MWWKPKPEPQPQEPVHKHTYEPRAVSQSGTWFETHVLYVCLCGASKTVEMKGHWSLEDVKGTIGRHRRT